MSNSRLWQIELSDPDTRMSKAASDDHGISFGEAARTWARIALLSFGGPAGQIAVMHRILVEEKKLDRRGAIPPRAQLTACSCPGRRRSSSPPISAGSSTGRRAGWSPALLFVLPGLVAIMALSWLYAACGNVGPVEALFFGLKAAVLAIVLEAVRRIGSRALSNPAMRGDRRRRLRRHLLLRACRSR